MAGSVLWYSVCVQKRFVLGRLLLIAVLAFGSGVGLLWWQQERLVYLPPAGVRSACPTALPHETITTPEGVRLLAFGQSTKLAVLYHGNAGTACDRVVYVRSLTSRGYRVLLVEYPGYGDGSGRPTHKRTRQAVESVRAYVRTVQPSTVLVLGESLGTGPAVTHATADATDHLILVTPFTRLSAVARASGLWWLSWLVRDPYDNAATLAAYSGSVLLLAAEHDEVIPVEHAHALHDAASSARNRRLVVAPGAGHNTILEQEGILQEIADWLR